MEKLMDIKCNWNMNIANDFDDKNMWIGQILLQDDGWFEGIVCDPKSFYTGDRFVFGAFHPGKVIELFKLSPSDVSDPFVFHGTKDNGYYGEFEIIGLFGTMPCGTSNIITQVVDAVREGSEEETQKLKEKIQNYKELNLDGANKDFYENTAAMRKTITQVTLRNHEGRGFSQEEAEELRKEYEPVNKKIMKSLDENAKGLVKKMSQKLFNNNDGDLPF